MPGCFGASRWRTLRPAARYANRWQQAGHIRPIAYRLTALVDKSQVIAVKQMGRELTVLVATVDYLDTEMLVQPSIIKKTPASDSAVGADRIWAH